MYRRSGSIIKPGRGYTRGCSDGPGDHGISSDGITVVSTMGPFL